MPSPEEYLEHIQEQIEKRITDDMQPKGPQDIWKPDSYEYKKERDRQQRQFKEDIFQDWQKMKETDPNEAFRKQTKKDIAEIKDAIRKIGIMFGEDAPSKEMMEKHKMLKDAYNKYKMIEALITGQDK